MLLDYMPTYYADSLVFANLMKAFTAEINTNNYSISDLENQLFIDTATWGLAVWENELNIYTDISKTYTDRREFIKSKLRGSGTCSIEMIKNTALAYTNAEISVIEDNPNYTFKIKFTGVKGIPRDVNAFKSTINSIKPAHLTYTVEYTYSVWNDIAAKTWGELATKTWEQVKTI